MKTAYIQSVGGASGDMLLGARLSPLSQPKMASVPMPTTQGLTPRSW